MELQRLTTVFDGDESQLLITFKKVDEGFTAAEKRAQESVSRFDRISASIGSALGKGIKLGLGDVGAVLDTIGNVTEAALKGIPVVGVGLAAAYRESSGAMREAVETGFAWNDMMKRGRISLGLIATGANEAGRELKGLRSISSNSEFGLSALIASAQELQIMQHNARDVVPEIQAIANAAAALNRGEGGLEAIAGVFARISEVGKASTRDIRALVAQGIPALDALAEHTGLSKGRAKRLLDSGRLSSKDFIDGMLNYFNQHYPQAAAQMAQTIEVQSKKYSLGTAALKGQAVENLYNSAVSGYAGLNAAIRGPNAGAIAANINAGMGAVESGLKLAFHALESGDLVSEAISAGGSLVEGIKKGIANKVGEAQQSVYSMADSVIEAAKSSAGFDINSPSKKTIPIGEAAAEGVAVGFESYMTREGLQRLTTSINETVTAAYQQTRGRRTLSSDTVAATRARVETLSQDPRIKALLDTIAKSEGGSYDRAFGRGGHIDPATLKPDGSNWYGEQVNSPTLGRKVWTHAYGRYQFEPATYRDFGARLGLTDVSPHSQDLAAILDLLSRKPQVVSNVMGGDVRASLPKLGSEWESFAIASNAKFDSLTKYFNQRVGAYMGLTVGDSAVSNSNPMPVSIVSDLTGGTGRLAGDGGFFSTATTQTASPIPNERGPMATSLFLSPKLTPLTVEVDKVGDAAQATAKRMSAFKVEMLGLGLDLKTIGDSFESNFTSAFDNIGAEGHSIARELVLGMAAEIKHNAGAFLAGELRDAVFGSADGEQKGLLGKLGGKLGGNKKGEAPTDAAHVAALHGNTTAENHNSVALERLTAIMNVAGKMSGPLSSGGQPAADDLSKYFEDSLTTAHDAASTLHESGHSLNTIDESVKQSGQMTFSALQELQQTIIAMQPQSPGLLGQILIAGLNIAGSALGAHMKGGGGGGGGGGGASHEGGHINAFDSRPTGTYSSGFGGHRAAGGPVDAGTLYNINEVEPEYFRPNFSGEVIPLSKMNGAHGGSHEDHRRYYTINMPAARPRSYASRPSQREMAENLVGFLKSRT